MRPWTFKNNFPVGAISVLMALLALLMGTGCAVSPATLADPTSPQPGYQRHIMVVLEREDFRPVPGATITIEVESPTQLVSPAQGYGKTNSQGGLELIFEPLAHYDEAAVAGGDVVVDYPVKAKLTVSRAGQAPLVFYLDDQESFARYADPLYQGLSRDPETEITYYNIVVP